MPYLGDYLGHLMSEIATARVQSDLETVRIAELYANHPLLRHLPVPRFRLPTVTLDVPVAVQKMEEAQPGESARGGLGPEAMRKSFDPLLDGYLARQNIKLTAAERTGVNRALDATGARLVQPPAVAGSVTQLADELVQAAVQALGDMRRKERTGELAMDEKSVNEFKAAARVEFLTQRKAPPRLQVLVTNAELREAGPPENLARLRLSISEESVEWTVIESQGKSTAKLSLE